MNSKGANLGSLFLRRLGPRRIGRPYSRLGVDPRETRPGLPERRIRPYAPAAEESAYEAVAQFRNPAVSSADESSREMQIDINSLPFSVEAHIS